jgi:hypothetical protein
MAGMLIQRRNCVPELLERHLVKDAESDGRHDSESFLFELALALQ